MNITDNSMWHIDFNYIDYRNGLLTYDGDSFETYMAVDSLGELRFGIKGLSYFADYGVPYEELNMLYYLLMEHEELPRRLWGRVDDPLHLIGDILHHNKIQDKKKKKK